MTQSRSHSHPRARFLPVLLMLGCALSACMVGPNYQRPSAPVTPAYKEAEGWTPANPSDAADRRDWWTVFNDPVLNDLEQRVEVSNQNLKAAEAAYRQAEALVSQQRAALFPTISLNGSASKSGGGGASIGSGNSAGRSGNSFQLGAAGTWEPDLWGRIRRTIANAKDNAQASAADLANARLSAQTSLALDYIQLRELDELKRLLDATTTAFERSLTVTQNKYNAGVAARSDVLAAQTQLFNAQATNTDVIQQRAKLEHAIAILSGRAPAELTLAPAPWTLKSPEIPVGVPSTLLQRRPDIAGAERRAAAANEQIGISISAFFPSLTLTGQGGVASSQLGSLLSASSTTWAIGAQAAETIFDAGARSAQARQSRALYDQEVALYRQTVLAGLGQVEDNLAAWRVLAVEQTQRDAAMTAAVDDARILNNQYRAGTVDYTAVVVAEASSLSAQESALQNQANQLAAAVDLISALGGGWTVEQGAK